jgi:NhaP-type Na+/H+ or K+/H+ antiporter
LLLVVVAAPALIAARLKIPPAILLVLTGVVLALVPGLPTVELAPELVLLLVLAPIICASAVAMSWREFRFNLRPISLPAVGCVLFTTVAIAAAAHWLLVSLGRWASYWVPLFRRQTLCPRTASEHCAGRR